MEQYPDQAGEGDDQASVGGVSSLDFNFLVEGETETVAGTTASAKDDISTLKTSSAFLSTAHNLTESSSPSKNKTTTKKSLTESPRRRKMEGAARISLLGILSEEEWEVHHRDHENRTSCGMDRGGLGGSAVLRDPVNDENRSQQTTDTGNL